MTLWSNLDTCVKVIRTCLYIFSTRLLLKIVLIFPSYPMKLSLILFLLTWQKMFCYLPKVMMQQYTKITSLIEKIVIDHLDFFAKTFTDIRKHHIKHRYSNEMAQKSHIVRSRSRFTIIILHNYVDVLHT